MRSERVSFLVGALLSAAVPAWAQPAPDARLEVVADPSCSTRDELVARVAARSTRIRFVSAEAGLPSMTARIEPGAKGAVVAELTVVEPDGRKFVRRLEAPSCAAATDALALVVAITLDPSVVATTDVSGAAADKSAASTATNDGAAAKPPEATAEKRPAGAPGANDEAAASIRRLTAGVAAEVVAGPAPTAMPGIALQVQGALDRPSIWSPAAILTLSHVWSGALAEAGATAEFTLDLLALDACPLRLAALNVEARACAAGALGRLSAQGSNTYDPRSVSRAFATAGGSALLTLVLWSRVELRARLGVGATLWRDAFEFTPEVFHRVASVTLVGDVGIGVRFP